MKEKFLPLGSVVLLEGGQKELMITGYCMETPDNPGKTYDYSGCIYPEGMISSKLTCVFDHSQIKEIYFSGYSNEKGKEFLDKLVVMSQEEKVSSEQPVEKFQPLLETTDDMERL